MSEIHSILVDFHNEMMRRREGLYKERSDLEGRVEFINQELSRMDLFLKGNADEYVDESTKTEPSRMEIKAAKGFNH